ncbi:MULTISPECIES: arsenic resistance protein [Bacteroidota]|mgnify:CR=1 FL=1|uniref:Arsenite efflux pump ArsB, ACR3 family n=1 Tax=Epilithonimonas pallida TaxID=373671 RepID=A0ABY1R0W7_9FLAO|nr:MULTISPECIES: bile acid:sodium symporter [Bacteroidota]SMP91423.1 Arsenite efflux pump ArsB, ACR3 family [Epilithonimonas pallida]
MDKINKYQTIVILIAVIVGLVIGQSSLISDISASFIIPLLMVMLFGLFLTIDISELKHSFLNIKFSITSILINFVWTPIFAYLLGSIFLNNDIAIWMGFVMLMVTPCTDWYLVFTSVAKGNVPLSTAILPTNLILQVLLLPVYLLLFFGKSGNVDLGTLAESIIIVLVIPFTLAVLAKTIVKSRKSLSKNAFLGFFETSQVFFLSLAVVAMFASEGKDLINHPSIIYKMLLPVLIFFFVAFLVAYFVSKILKFNYADRVSLTLTTMARNSPISLAIAVSAFSAEPLIALALVIGPLIELPILVLTTQSLLRTQKE